MWDGEQRALSETTGTGQLQNEVDAAKNASTLCRIIGQDAEWRMMLRDNAHPSILQPMRLSVELLKVCVVGPFKHEPVLGCAVFATDDSLSLLR